MKMQRSKRFSTQQIVTGSMLTAILVPFILLTDIYPFFRFGMFAEPVTQRSQLEQFAIRYIQQNQTAHLLNPAEMGLGSLSYLMRNYYYRQQSGILLQNIHHIYNADVREWQLLRITSLPDNPAQTDTTTVATYRP